MLGKFLLHSRRGQIGFRRSEYSKYSSLQCVFRLWSLYETNNRRRFGILETKEGQRQQPGTFERRWWKSWWWLLSRHWGKAISIHCLRINASEYFLSVLCVIVNVFQAAQIYHYYAVKYITKSLFVSVTCWRTCQNMKRSISHSHRNLEIHTWDQTHTHTPPKPL